MQLHPPSRRTVAALAAAATAVATATSLSLVAAPAGAAPVHARHLTPSQLRVAKLPSPATVKAAHAARLARTQAPRATGTGSVLGSDSFAVRSQIAQQGADNTNAGLNYVDLTTRTTGVFSQPTDDVVADPMISRDGTKVAYQFYDFDPTSTDGLSYTIGIKVLTVGSSAAPVTLASTHFNGDSKSSTEHLYDEPAFSADGNTVYFDYESVTNPGYLNDPTATQAQLNSVVTVVEIDSVAATGGTSTTYQANAVTPSFDGSGNFVYSQADNSVTSNPASTSCLVFTRAAGATASTCTLTYGQAAAKLPGASSTDLEDIFSPDVQGSRSSTSIAVTFAYAYNRSADGTTADYRNVVGEITNPGASSTLTLFSSTVLTDDGEGNTQSFEQEPEFDPTGTAITFSRGKYTSSVDGKGQVTSSIAGALFSVDTTSGRHLAQFATPATGNGSTLIRQINTPTASDYVPLDTPTRVLDTRKGIGTPTGQPGKIGPGASIDVKVTGGLAQVPSSATAVVLNLTATNATSATFIQAYPVPASGSAVPRVSNVNLTRGQTIANAATVALPASQSGLIRIGNSLGTTDVLADVVGYYITSPAVNRASLFTPLTTPKRVLDTRKGVGAPQTRITAQHYVDVQIASTSTTTTSVPSTATSVVLQVGGIGATAPTFLDAYPTPSGTGNTVPTTSTVNVAKGETRANLATVTVGSNGKVRFYSDAGQIDAYADVVGYYTPATGATSGNAFVPLAPSRIFDTRDVTNEVNGVAGPIGPKSNSDATTIGQLTTSSGLNLVGAGATAVQLNVTAPVPSASTYLSLYGAPDTAGSKSFSNVNATRGSTTAGAAIAAIGSLGQTAIYNDQGSTNVILDLSGYFVPVQVG